MIAYRQTGGLWILWFLGDIASVRDAVCVERNSSSAISLFVNPLTTAMTTSRSRQGEYLAIILVGVERQCTCDYVFDLSGRVSDGHLGIVVVDRYAFQMTGTRPNELCLGQLCVFFEQRNHWVTSDYRRREYQLRLYRSELF